MSSFVDLVSVPGPDGPPGNQGPDGSVGPLQPLLVHYESDTVVYMTTTKTTIFSVLLTAGKLKIGDRLRIRIPGHVEHNASSLPNYTWRLESPSGTVWVTSASYAFPASNGNTTPWYMNLVIDIWSATQARVMMDLLTGSVQNVGCITGAGTGGGGAVHSQLIMAQMNVDLTAGGTLLVTIQASTASLSTSTLTVNGGFCELEPA
jgi:hypothetical protein